MKDLKTWLNKKFSGMDIKTKDLRKGWWQEIDKFILLPTIFLFLFGIIAISSISQHLTTKVYLPSDIILKKHLIFCFLGLLIIFLTSNLSMKNLVIISFILFFGGIILSFTAIFFFPETKGANRWIKILNYSFQPSEFLKPSFIIVSAVFLGRYKIKNDSSLFINIICLVIVSLLLILQPDFGMFILIFGAWILQILTSNLRKNIILPIISSFIFVFTICFFSLEHVRFRIMNFIYSDIGDNYQITKSIKSFENGGFFGKGIGEASVSRGLPDVQSDFIFALIGEELGAFFALLIIFMYLILYTRAHIVSQKSNNLFVIISITGIANLLIFQVIINLSSTLNIIPTKGMTLPFISYGGSSLISSSLMIGFLLLLIKNRNNE